MNRLLCSAFGCFHVFSFRRTKTATTPFTTRGTYPDHSQRRSEGARRGPRAGITLRSVHVAGTFSGVQETSCFLICRKENATQVSRSHPSLHAHLCFPLSSDSAKVFSRHFSLSPWIAYP
ncbi:hypothetical protein BS47DRAFT_607540 [Hydnum rufescens UP504]|uniref:Uncharacterized protein n=1 Tax=Hydnum rufescens UP504 TaxID=1448309 RepID=A0A9P6DZA3_9AGAM|nr:hypothetical protein BS47DRAFT_607540 [Hydnum rufescens UP504]